MSQLTLIYSQLRNENYRAASYIRLAVESSCKTLSGALCNSYYVDNHPAWIGY